MEALRALKLGDEVESSNSKGKGKELAVQHNERRQHNCANNCHAKNLIVDLDEQQQKHNPEGHQRHVRYEVHAEWRDRRRRDEQASSLGGVKRNKVTKEENTITFTVGDFKANTMFRKERKKLTKIASSVLMIYVKVLLLHGSMDPFICLWKLRIGRFKGARFHIRMMLTISAF